MNGGGVPPAALLLSMATEHWEEHELPGIHNQPERPARRRELPEGAAEGKAPGVGGGVLLPGLVMPGLPL